MKDTHANSWKDPKPEYQYQPPQCKSQLVIFAHLESLRFSNSAFSLFLSSGPLVKPTLTLEQWAESTGSPALQEPTSCRKPAGDRELQDWHRKIGEFTCSKSLKFVLKNPWQQKK